MSNGKQIKKILLLDFDDWMVLAKNDPDEFEIRRREQIELFFESIPKDKQQRLKGLQWKIDQTRKISRSPMASCIAISNMMWDSVRYLNERQYELVNVTLGQGLQINKPETVNAKILPIPTRTH